MRTARWLRLGAATATAIALVAAAITGAMLARWYVPASDGVDPSLLPVGHQRSRTTADLHGIATFVAVPLAIGWAAIHLAVVRRDGGRQVTAAATTAVVVVTTIVAAGSWPMVQWDQLALTTITSDTDHLRSLWAAGFADDVSFVLVDGAERTQRSYAAALVVHLASPFLALVGMAAAWVTGRRPAGASSSMTHHAVP